ncbi:hypothetical protein Sango_2668100 [Sesamum angolense]|uniref:Uncharacterized protein n=1 Tax=Sesamum angolense TaxID=2727404 RepID=A0AAE1W2A2_9LAMI|nr:hypothetical protein Sango_2668100 [Sesamum angolense]
MHLLFYIPPLEYRFAHVPHITLSLQALEKSKYEQSLDSVRRFIAIAEKELELYYRHVALYGDPNDRDPKSILDHKRTIPGREKAQVAKSLEGLSAAVDGSDDEEISEFEDTSDDERKSSSDLDCEDADTLSEDLVSSDDIADNSFFVQESAATQFPSLSDYRHKLNGQGTVEFGVSSFSRSFLFLPRYVAFSLSLWGGCSSHSINTFRGSLNELRTSVLQKTGGGEG